MRRLLGTLALLVLAAVGSLAWLLLVYPEEPAKGSAESFLVRVPHGATAREVVELLHDAGAVEEPRLFAAYLRLQRADSELRSGDVLLAGNLKPAEVLRRIARGRGRIPVRVVIPEGFTRFDVAARLDRLGVGSESAILDATAVRPAGAEAPSLEGYLFPDTYDFVEGTRAEEVVQRLVSHHERRVEPLLRTHADALERLEADFGWGPHEVLVLASVVEKEAAVPEERAIIAGVFLNRLRSETFRPRHRLQADPTVSYGCLAEPADAPSCADYEGTITSAMLDDAANRYNTYRHGGLPPGPVANPGLDAIRAVLAPAQHDYLYFVARGGGRHTFSADLAEHNEAVRRYRAQ